MAALPVNVKRHIVQALACFDTPSEVSKAVKEEFDIDVPRMQVQKYDPTKAMGKDLSKELRELFEETRAKFKADVEAIPVANQTYRLRSLNRLFQLADSKGNPVLAAQLLEQAAKEVGGAYTNQRQLSGIGGKPIEVTDPARKYTDAELDRRLAELQAKHATPPAG